MKIDHGFVKDDFIIVRVTAPFKEYVRKCATEFGFASMSEFLAYAAIQTGRRLEVEKDVLEETNAS